MALFEAIVLGVILAFCGLLAGAVFLAIGLTIVMTIKVLIER